LWRGRFACHIIGNQCGCPTMKYRAESSVSEFQFDGEFVDV
jgi:hypothetical protein